MSQHDEPNKIDPADARNAEGNGRVLTILIVSAVVAALLMAVIGGVFG